MYSRSTSAGFSSLLMIFTTSAISAAESGSPILDQSHLPRCWMIRSHPCEICRSPSSPWLHIMSLFLVLFYPNRSSRRKRLILRGRFHQRFELIRVEHDASYASRASGRCVHFHDGPAQPWVFGRDFEGGGDERSRRV